MEECVHRISLCPTCEKYDNGTKGKKAVKALPEGKAEELKKAAEASGTLQVTDLNLSEGSNYKPSERFFVYPKIF